MVFELQQTHAFMESELRRSDFNTQIAIRLSELGENPMVVYERACMGEEPLTVMDIVVGIMQDAGQGTAQVIGLDKEVLPGIMFTETDRTV